MWRVRASADFWRSVAELRPKYSKEEYIEIVRSIREAIGELERDGHITFAGWDEHLLLRAPFADESHFEFHVGDDDVLVVYFKRFSRRTIRMVGAYDHGSIPGSRAQ